MIEKKVCKGVCGKKKPVTEFYRTQKIYFSPQCKECTKKLAKEKYLEKNINKYKLPDKNRPVKLQPKGTHVMNPHDQAW